MASGNNIKTEGIVLSCIKYGDNGIIVSILTQVAGQQSYMLKLTGRNRRSVLPLMQPLSIVDIEAVHSQRATVQKLTEVHVSKPLMYLPFDPIKRSIGLFVTELLLKSLRSSVADEQTYLFVRNSVLVLDEGIGGEYNFHLYFMWKLMRLLGFEPDVSCATGRVFDMVEGCFATQMPLHRHIISGSDIELWLILSRLSLDNLASTQLNRLQRQRMIALMEQFYTLHIPSFSGLNAASVLAQIA